MAGHDGHRGWIYSLAVRPDLRTRGGGTALVAHAEQELTRPRHGDAVMQFLTERSDGRPTLGPASLYATLKKLRDAGFIEELDGGDARRGQRLPGFSLAAHGWRFEDAEPEDVIFDMAYETDPDDDYFDLFRAAGWTPVLTYGHIHFFKATPGTAPVHTGTESRLEEALDNRSLFLRYTAVTLAAVLLVVLVMTAADWPRAAMMAAATLSAVALVYTSFPLVGYHRQVQRLRRMSVVS